MIERRSNQYGLRVLWVAKRMGRADVAVIAKGGLTRWYVYAIDGERLVLRQKFKTFAAAGTFAETLVDDKRP